MPSLGKRIFSLFDRLTRRARNAAAESGEAFDWEWEERRDQYARWDKLYANTIYLKQQYGGLREILLREVIERNPALVINGYFAPVRAICDAYQNVFRGVWGRDIWATNPDGDEFEKDSAMYAALAKVWRWSNMDTQKGVLQSQASRFGTVGLRVVANSETGRVRIMVDHPGRIVDFDEDSEGNVTAVLLEYSELTGDLGKRRSTQKIRELLTTKEFVKEIDGRKAEPVPNALGLCPYVILRHDDSGGEYGLPSFYGSEEIMHLINWRISRQDKSIDRNQFPRWFATGGGQKPTEVELGEDKLAYVQTMEGTPPPTLEALVPNIQQSDTQAFWSELIELMKQRQPELILNDIAALSGQSGETIAQLLKPVEQRVLQARAQYEDAMIRAMKLGLGWMSLIGLGDAGTGTGSVSAAQKAVRDDATAFTFNTRPALAESPYDRIKSIEADTKKREVDFAAAQSAGDNVSQRERLRIMGYSDSEIEKIEKEISEQDVIDSGGDDLLPFGNGQANPPETGQQDPGARDPMVA